MRPLTTEWEYPAWCFGTIACQDCLSKRCEIVELKPQCICQRDQRRAIHRVVAATTQKPQRQVSVSHDQRHNPEPFMECDSTVKHGFAGVDNLRVHSIGEVVSETYPRLYPLSVCFSLPILIE